MIAHLTLCWDRWVPVRQHPANAHSPVAQGSDCSPRRDPGPVLQWHRDVNLDKLGLSRGANLALRVIASSGSELVGYHGHNSQAAPRGSTSRSASLAC